MYKAMPVALIGTKYVHTILMKKCMYLVIRRIWGVHGKAMSKRLK